MSSTVIGWLFNGWLLDGRDASERRGARAGGRAGSDKVAVGVDTPEDVSRPRTIRHIDGIPETELWDRIARGDVTAFALLYHAYATSLLQLGAALTRSRETAEELLHDVFSMLWERRDTLTRPDDVGVYLRAAIRHRAYNHAKHAAVVHRVEDRVQREMWDVPAMGAMPAPDEILDAHEIERAVKAILDAIPEHHRQILALRWNEGLTQQDIAHVFGVSRARIRKLIARYEARLAPLLERLRLLLE